MNLGMMLQSTAGKYGEKAAIVAGKRRMSYAGLDEASNKVADALMKMGVEKGDRVAMLLSNCPEFVTLFFGIIKAGGIAVPLDVRYKVEELACLFADCRPKVLVAESDLLQPIVPALPRFDSIEHIISLGSGYEGKFPSYTEILAMGSASGVEVEPVPDDIAMIAYTGGPTNHPRGAMLSHGSLIIHAMASAYGLQQTDKDIVVLFALPMYHMFGLASVILTSVNKGSTVVMVPGTGVSIGSFMEAVEKEKATIYLGVPYIYALAVKVAEREGIKNDLSSIRVFGSAGAPLSVDVIQQFKRYYGYTIADIWGLTEVISHITCPPPDGTGKLGACGKVLPGWELGVVDEDDNELPPNQTGEIVVSGAIMKGYYNNPQATAEVIKDGWLYTGDIGRVDEDGYLFLSGRNKELIILKGQNIWPSDIEEVLCTHPSVARAVVTGVPDKLRGEIVGAAVALKEGKVATEQEIKQFCQQHMADYKVPRLIVFTDSLPESVATEISRESLRDYFSTLSPP